MARYVYDLRDYFNMLRLYFENDKQESRAAAAYQVEYQGRGNPDRNVISGLVDRLSSSGRVMPIYGGERFRAARTEEISDNAQGYHRYHHRRVQSLLANDAARRLNFCRGFVEKMEADMDYPRRILWTGECSFARDGIHSAHNDHCWSNEKSHLAWEKSFEEGWVINAWAGLLDDRLIGPVYLPSRLDGDLYLEFLQKQLPDLIHPAGVDTDDLPLTKRNIILQHDDTPAHFQNNVRVYLDQTFPNGWMGRGGPTPWPSRSPDLTPVNSFLRRAINESVYRTKVRSQEECLQKLEGAFEFYRQHPEKIRRATSSVVDRARGCIEEDGYYFEHLL